VAISTGGVFTCALTSSGAVKCWGANGRGTLGDGTTVNRFAPVAVAGLSSGVGAIATGWDHGCALTISGAATCWGSNASGQLGDGTARGRPYPVAIPAFASLVRARASLSTSALGLGAHTLRAGFGGDASHGSFIGSAPHRVVE
jgi:alpha-tubulin suppressor-like RCC1 family protein